MSDQNFEAPKSKLHDDKEVGINNPFIKVHTGFLHTFRRNLITGTLILGPIALTIYLLYHLFLFLDGFLARFINFLLRQGLGFSFFGADPVPGLGFIALLLLVLLTGWGARNVIGSWVIKRSQEILDRIPLVNNVYKTFNQISQALFSGRKDMFKRAVLIQYPLHGVYSIGVVTADYTGVIQDYLPEESVSVFIVTTPNPTTGFLVYVPRKDVIDLNMSVEDALKIVISGGLVTPKSIKPVDV